MPFMAPVDKRGSLTSVSAARVLTAAEDTWTITTTSGVVDVYSRDPAFVVAVVGRYLVQIVRRESTSTTVSLVRRGLSDLASRYDKFAFVALLEPDAQLLLPPDIRNGYSALIKRYSPQFTGAAIVLEKKGFHATAVRSVVTAINVASRASHPNQVFSDLREGVSWLSTLTPPDPTAAGLLSVIQLLRAARE
jgi:hypothetical protein